MSGNTKHYTDIISLPRHTSLRYRQLAVNERAWQFSPFMALEGLSEKITEAEAETQWKYEKKIPGDL